MTPSLSHSHGWHTIGGDPTLAAREGRECVSHTPHEFRPMVFLRRHPVMGPIGMMLSVVSLCGIVFSTSAHAIDWSPLIPDGDGIVAGANGRDDSTWIATLLVVLGAVVGLAIFGGVCLFVRLTLTTFKEALAAEREADQARFDTACTTFATECERQRADHKEQRAEDRVAFDSRTTQMVTSLGELPERLSSAVMRAMRQGNA